MAKGTEIEAARTIALLEAQAEGLRGELARLRESLTEVQREISGSRAAQLLEANEQLVLSTLHAQTISDTAMGHLGELLAASRLPPPEPPLRATPAEHEAHLRDLREANEQLVLAAVAAQLLEQQAGEAHRRQIKFLAMVAHELRNPLNPIRTAAEMIADARADGPLLGQLQGIIKRQVAHMTRLVEDLLDGSRVATGKLRLERSVVEMADAIGLAVEACMPAIDKRQQRLVTQLPPGPLSVYGDLVRLTQIFANLLDNASKYTPQGGAIGLVAVAQRRGLEVTVSDNGVGISEAALPRVFDLFAQDEHALALDNRGLGVGLAVVRELVEAHGGSVVANSAGRNLGSQFSVHLPMVDRQAQV